MKRCIHVAFLIQVSENDALPLQLCYHCAATLLAWHELLEGCLNAERRLLQMQVALQERQVHTELKHEATDNDRILYVYIAFVGFGRARGFYARHIGV